jgi:Kef-type K+ transport system membrane component KefB/mannitol/fructose-specific phosphotransferase system IIA component
MQKLSHEEVLILLLQLSVILIFARLFGELARKINQPAVIGEILAGVILGPTVLGYFSSDVFNGLFANHQHVYFTLDGIASIGVILLLFVAGMELELPLILQQGKNATIISLSGIIFPFFLGFGSGWLFYDLIAFNNAGQKLVFALFFGTALSISALPVIAKTLMDLNILKSKVGRLILASAMVDDLLGWILFSIILGMMGSTVSGFGISETIILVLLFVLFALTFGKYFLDKILLFIKENFSFPGAVISFAMTLCFMGALFTEFVGIHAIFGAFIIGIAIGDSANLTHDVREIIHQFVTNIFAPIFFVSIGIRVNFVQNFNLLIVLFVLVFAYISKVLGVGLGSYYLGRMSFKESFAIGFGMNARGTMGIILGTLALQTELINEDMFVAFIIMAIVTSITSGPMLKYFLKEGKKISFIDLISAKVSFISNAATKEEVIRELCDVAALGLKLKSEDIYKEVWLREKQLPTGIANYIAIPHAKVKINKPLITVALNKNGIDFSSLDETPAKIIFLLLTPLGNSELQLSLLAEIARTFSDRDRVEEELLDEDNLNYHNIQNFILNKTPKSFRGFE